MRRIVMAVIPLLSFAAGCDFFKNKQRFYTYCDDTGCYTCDEHGCVPRGDTRSPSSRPGTHPACTKDTDCQQGCYCNLDTGTCTEAGYCDQQSQCGSGFVCDASRHSCHPGVETAGGGGAGTTCATNSECRAGYFCHPTTKQCLQSWSCTTAADCGAGMICDGRHTCVPGPSSCTTSADCAAGCYCQNGTCNETALCKADSDCKSFGAGYTCQVGTCTPASASTGSTASAAPACQFNNECGVDGLCVNGACQAPCAASATCGTGLTCTNGHCAPATGGGGVTIACASTSDCGGGGLTCVGGTCQPTCASTADCANAADTCVAGMCRANTGRVPQCRSNAQCSTGQECVNAICRSRCFGDNDCNACSGTPVCNMGYCVAQIEVSPQCKLTGDCGSTQSCVNATCQ